MKLKTPKLISVLLIFILLVFSMVLITVMSGVKPKDEIVDPDILITSPKPISIEDKKISELERDLNNYQKKVDGLSDSIQNYPPPKVDLEIKF